MTAAPGLRQRQQTARLLQELCRPASAAVVAALPPRPGAGAPADDVRQRSGLSIQQFWTTVSRLETLRILRRDGDELALCSEVLQSRVEALVADSPLPALLADRPQLASFAECGRIVRMPTDPVLTEDLCHALAELFVPGETSTEDEVNERIADVHDDPAEIRRALIDRGLLRRAPGSALYTRA